MRLSSLTMASASPAVERPRYDRTNVTPGVVHLGVGAFHRAHQAAYLDDLLAADPRWGVVGASLRRPDVAAALAPQDGLYTLQINDGLETRRRIIGAILEVIVAPQAPERAP